MNIDIKNMKNILFVVHGGIGKNIMATAVLRNIKNAYPDKKIIVMCGYPDIFLRNPKVDRLYNLHQPQHVYEDYIKDSKTYPIGFEPYLHPDYIYKKRHCVECWCDMIGIQCDSIYPEFFFNKSEDSMADIYLGGFNKKMILIQGVGGKNPEGKDEKNRIVSAAQLYRRNLPQDVIQSLVDKLKSDGYEVGTIQASNQFQPKGSQIITFPPRAIIELVPRVAGIIAIDSFVQHAAAAFKKPAVVCWGGTSPSVLGYDIHRNLTRKACNNPFCHRPNSYLWDFQTTGFLWDCPYDEVCMNFNSDDIINALKKQIGDEYGKTEIDKASDEKTEGPCTDKGCPRG